MTPNDPDLGLFQPTLTPEDDASGFKQPWSPNRLLWLGFLGGVPAAGALYALNFLYLGMDRRFWPTVLATIAVAVIAAAATIAFFPEDASSGARRSIRLANQLLAVAFGWVLSRYQTRRFEIYEKSGGESRPLLKPAILAILGSIVVVVGLLTLFSGLL